MARDPQARAVDRQMMNEFAVCDNDGRAGLKMNCFVCGRHTQKADLE